jgi:hypothetical protein
MNGKQPPLKEKQPDGRLGEKKELDSTTVRFV